MVDVGGGLGHVSLIVARENPAVHVAIEDRDALRAESKEVSNFSPFSCIDILVRLTLQVLGEELTFSCPIGEVPLHKYVHYCTTFVFHVNVYFCA